MRRHLALDRSHHVGGRVLVLGNDSDSHRLGRGLDELAGVVAFLTVELLAQEQKGLFYG